MIEEPQQALSLRQSRVVRVSVVLSYEPLQFGVLALGSARENGDALRYSLSDN
jgi:hypothetical protein